MSYQQALEKAWNALSEFPRRGEKFTVKLLSDTYTVNLESRMILSDSCNVPAKDYISIIILHYLARKLRPEPMPPLTGEWIDFKELEGGEGYYAAFKKRTIDRILKKYGANPSSLKAVTGRMPAETVDKEDAAIVIHPFPEVSILITMSEADEEFGPGANILFDRNISKIFCTEDTVVLTEMISHQL